MMEAVRTSETSVDNNFTRQYIPEDNSEHHSVRSFPGFRMDITRACFHAGGKYCLRRTALNNFVIKVMTLLGRSLSACFGTPFGPGALPTLIPLMASWTSEGLLNFVSLAGAYFYARITSSTASVTAGDDGSFTG
jgi:hypothetical protein